MALSGKLMTFSHYTERLADEGAAPSVGSRGDAYDNALAERAIGLYKTELIRNRGPWRNIDEVEYATLEWVGWFNHRRILEPIGNIPPGEFEAYYWRKEGQEETEGLKEPSIWYTRGGSWTGNIFVERLWRSVKYEEVYLKAYESLSEARAGLGDYFEFYNVRRRHQGLDYRTPDEVYWDTLTLKPEAA